MHAPGKKWSPCFRSISKPGLYQGDLRIGENAIDQQNQATKSRVKNLGNTSGIIAHRWNQGNQNMGCRYVINAPQGSETLEVRRDRKDNSVGMNVNKGRAKRCEKLNVQAVQRPW